MELISKVRDYVGRRMTLRDLESWLVPRLPVFLAEPESQAGRLASAVELCLAELNAGIRSERSIRALLCRQMSDNPVVRASIGEPQSEDTSATSSQPMTTLQWMDQPLVWSIESQVVSV